MLQRQIEATDRQIDQLVYELYGLTEEEIAIVEGRRTIAVTALPGPAICGKVVLWIERSSGNEAGGS